MHPAYSVIFFTVATGGGYGLLALLGVLGAMGRLPGGVGFGLAAFGLSLGLITFGLLASTYHLGRPDRAWRAFSQWRSSWLSREGVAAVVTYAPALLFAAGWIGFVEPGPAWQALGWATAAMAAVTVYCTGMIYRSLDTIREWHNGWTVANYLVLALATGAVWLNVLLLAFDGDNPILAAFTVAALAGAWLAKVGYWRFIDDNPHPSTPESATGLGGIGRVRALESPHTEANYLMKEMGFRVARAHAAKLRRYAQALGFAVPMILVLGSGLGAGGLALALAVMAALSSSAGMAIERWLFFAEARHVVMLFYGATPARRSRADS